MECEEWEKEKNTMMMSPESYLKEYENANYIELLKLKNELVQCITEFEHDYDMDESIWSYSPSPDVSYQWNLEVLGKVSLMLREAFNKEYEMGEKSMADFYSDVKSKL